MERFWPLFGRAVRLRCPFCGKGKLYRDLFQMHETCPECEVKFEREPGFFLGSIYINYGLTAAIVATLYMVLYLTKALPYGWVIAMTLTIALLFPVVFHRYARSLWLGFDQWCDPREGTEEQQEK